MYMVKRVVEMIIYDTNLFPKNVEKEYDVIIIGGSAAGLTASIYTTRSALKTLVISKDIGGQIVTTPEIENYPGFEKIAGIELVKRMEMQARKFGSVILEDVVERIRQEGNIFYVKSSTFGEFISKAVIIATGRDHRKLGIPGEKEYAGKGVSYCATCDGPFFKNKVVAVIGGGNSGFTTAEYLSKIASKVYLIHRRRDFKAEKYLIEKVTSLDNVEILVPYMPVEIYGGSVVKGIKLKNVESENYKELEVDGVFVEIGTKPNTEFLNGFVDLNEYGEIMVDRNMRTSKEGVFAAGDVTNTRDKQIAVAVGEGCIAGLSAKEYLYEGERNGKWKIIGL